MKHRRVGLVPTVCMKVLELSVRADAEGAEAIAALFDRYAYGGAVIEQIITPERGETLDPAHPFTVRAFLLADETLEAKKHALEEAIWHLRQLRPFGELQERELVAEDYAEAWKKFYSILHVGRRLVIKPSWLDYAPQPGEIVIELDPGMAFGTGLHPTTRLCLAALEKYVRPGVRVLDVGTGSGILALAAVKLGAASVEACDIDPLAVETAQRNIAHAGLTKAIRVHLGTLTLEPHAEPYDLIAANIFADTIVELAPALAQHLQPTGILIASGILVEHASRVESALRAYALRLEESAQEEDWLAMIFSLSVA